MVLTISCVALSVTCPVSRNLNSPNFFFKHIDQFIAGPYLLMEDSIHINLYMDHILSSQCEDESASNRPSIATLYLATTSSDVAGCT